MKAPQTIPRSGTPDPATSYQALLSRGLDDCQKLAGDVWTDYNEHDPGVTILEQLCYALTDLSYRIDYEIPDILASSTDVPSPTAPGNSSWRNDTLYTGDRILTSSPITQNDYRNLLFDRIKGLKNAWLVPVTGHPLGVQGLYDILVELREEIEDPEGPEATEIKREVLKLMRRTRNLGEDIRAIEILKPQPVHIEATVVIAPHADPANVLASVLFEIQNCMIPFPQVQLLSGLLNTMPPEDVWSGPLLNLGALDQSSLRPIQTRIRVQEIANIILQVRGVKRVKGLRLGNVGGDMTTDSLPLQKHHVPRIDPPIFKIQPGYTIQMELEGGFKCLPDAGAVWSKIRELETAKRSSIAYAARSLSELSYIKVPTGTDRNIQDYYSIQHQFPAVYGLGRFGLANGLIESSKSRTGNQYRARIHQLRAYLLVFEQLLADNLAQLANVSKLFSLDEDLDRSYFYQSLVHDPPRPGDPPAIADVLLQGPTIAPHRASHYLVCVIDSRGEIVFTSGIQSGLAKAEETRKQIAECGRSIGNYRSFTATSGEARLILHGNNNAVLAHGQERFTSHNASREGAERWVRFFVRLLHDPQQLEDSIKLLPYEDVSFQVVDERSRIVIVGRGSASIEERDRCVEKMLECGVDRNFYRLLSRGHGKFELGLLNRDGEAIAKSNQIFATEFDVEEGANALIELLRSMAAQKSVRDRHLRLIPPLEQAPAGPLSTYHQGLARLARSTDRDYLLRRNHFLDHLLARFAEQFDDQILERLDLRPYGEKDGFYEELLRWKIAFLRSYVQQDSTSSASIGGGRARAFDYSDPHDSAISAFERRIALLLGLRGHMAGSGYRMGREGPTPEPGYFYMEDHPGRTPAEGAPDPGNLHDNFVFYSEDSSVSHLLLGSGANPDYYAVKPAGHEFHILFHPPEKKQPIVIHHAPTQEEARQRVTALIRYFRQIYNNPAEWYRGEDLHLVEHLLLRPEEGSQELAGLVSGLAARPHAHDTILKTTVADDFYSHRISVFLPDWPMRFQNNEFKLYAEQIIHENAPAHLAVDCYWLSAPEMREFEQLYSQWRKLKCALALAEVRQEADKDVPSAPALNQQAEQLKAFIERLQARESGERRAQSGRPPNDRSRQEAGHS